jgi:hypothetical protein
MKRYDVNDEVDGTLLWPEADVSAAYAAVEAETKDGGELYALRRFHRRMQFFLKTASESVGCNLTGEAVAYAYEAPALEKDLAAIRCGVCPVPGCPSGPAAPEAPDVAVPIIKQHKDICGQSDGINSIEFYPAERVKEVFERMAAALNTPREPAELKIFYLRLARLYDEANYSNTWISEDEIFKAYAEKESAEDAEFVRGITGGAVC